jgi:Fusaric acid resistance protein-like
MFHHRVQWRRRRAGRRSEGEVTSVTCVTKRLPSTVESIGGLRLAAAFITPVALGEALGHTVTGLFIGIGAFMVANADFGESYPQRLRLMVPTTLAVAAAASAGFVVGATEWLVVAIGVALFFVGGLSSAVGREAGMLGTLVSFAYVIGVGVTAAPHLSAAGLAVPLLAGGAYAMALSALQVRVAGHDPDEAPEGWPSLIGRAIARTDRNLLRHACAVALAGGIGLIVVPFTHQSNGAWLVTGALIVLRPEYVDTLKTAGQRAAATVAGAVLAGTIAAATSEPALLLGVAFVLTWLAESVIRRSFVAFVVLITPLSILLTNVIAPGDWKIAFLRTADVAAGSLIATAVATVLLVQNARPASSNDITAAPVPADNILKE